MATADWSRKTSDVPEGVRRQWRADREVDPGFRTLTRRDPLVSDPVGEDVHDGHEQEAQDIYA